MARLETDLCESLQAQGVSSQNTRRGYVVVGPDDNESCSSLHSRARVCVQINTQIQFAHEAAWFFANGLDRSSSISWIFATKDESMCGRCIAAFKSPPGCSSRFVLVSDARLNGHMLADIVRAVMDAGSQLSVTHMLVQDTQMLQKRQRLPLGPIDVVERLQIEVERGSHAHLECALRAMAAIWPGTSRGREPNLAKVFARAPAPVQKLSNSAITFAGGRVAVALIDPDSARQIVLEGSGDFKSGWDSSSMSSGMSFSDAGYDDTPLRSACADAGLECGEGAQARIHMLICQSGFANVDGAPSDIVHEGFGQRMRVLVCGIPAVHVAAIAHIMYARLMGPRHKTAHDFALASALHAMPTLDQLNEGDRLRCERTAAGVTIAGHVSKMWHRRQKHSNICC